MSMKKATISIVLLILSNVLAAQTISLTIDTSVTGNTISNSFVGFSFNPAYSTQYFGTSYNGNNDRVISAQLFSNLRPYQNPAIRIIGANGSYWKGLSPYNNVPANWNNTSTFNCAFCPGGTTPSFSTVIDSTDLNNVKGFIESLNYAPQVLFGINLSVIDSARSRDFASSVKNKLTAAGDLQFEIGNEPDLFVSNGRRNNGYNIIPYTKEFNLISKGVASFGFSAAPAFAKADNSSSTSWSDSLAYLLDSTGGRIKTVTLHDYPMGSYTGNNNLTTFLNKFLSNQYTYTEVNDPATGLISSINTSKSRNMNFRLAEANSVANSGMPQVSNAFGAALWGMDFMFELARAGASGINFSTEGASSSYYSPFLYNSAFTESGKVAVRPLYYGMLLFAKAAQGNARFVKQTYTSSIDSNQVKIWTVEDTAGVIRTLIIHRGASLSDTSSKTIQLNIPGRVLAAKAYLLKPLGSNGIADTTGALLAGQNININSGALSNTETTTSITPASGVYSISVKAATAVLVEVPRNNCSVAPVANNVSRCGMGNITISASPDAGETIDWYTAASGGNLILSSNTQLTLSNLASTTTYYAQARNPSTGCSFATRIPVTATINPLPNAPATQSLSLCDSGTITFSVALDAGETADWYSATTGGNNLLTGNLAYTTPKIYSATNFYVESRKTATGCLSQNRTPMLALVNHSSSSTSATMLCASDLPYLWNGSSYASGGMYSKHFTNAAGCDSTASLVLTVDSCSISLPLHLKFYLQGPYTGGGMMTPMLYNQGVGADTAVTDSVTIQLKDPVSFVTKKSATALLASNGQLSTGFKVLPGNYRVAIRHRNSIETWSSGTVTLANGTTPFYDFSTAASKAYLGNEVELSTGVFGFYAGDINQDGVVNQSDYAVYELNNSAGTKGYQPADLNGDGYVDLFDFPVLDSNAQNAISTQHP